MAFLLKVTLVLSLLVGLPWIVYGDARCIVAECRISR